MKKKKKEKLELVEKREKDIKILNRWFCLDLECKTFFYIPIVTTGIFKPRLANSSLIFLTPLGPMREDRRYVS